MKTILVPVDFSAVTAALTKNACRLARLTGCEVVLLHSVDIPVTYDPTGVGATMMVEAIALNEKFAAKRLHALVRRSAGNAPRIRAVIRKGRATDMIINEARALDAEFIVLGSHGHGAVYDLFVGSTTQGVLKRATCPVLVVPMAERLIKTRPRAKR